MDHLVQCLLGTLIVLYLAVSVNAVNYGGACTVNGNCTETNTVCNSTSGVCVCGTSTYRNTTACAPKINFNNVCNIAYGDVQCYGGNSTCMANSTGVFKCLCIADFYFEYLYIMCIPRKRPGVACYSDNCVVNAACTNSTCVCNLGYYATPAVNPTACSGVTMVTVNILLFALGVVAQRYFRLQH